MGVEDLVIHTGRVTGVIARQGVERRLYGAPAVVLATGGIGQLYRCRPGFKVFYPTPMCLCTFRAASDGCRPKAIVSG